MTAKSDLPCGHDSKFGVLQLPKEDHGCLACGYERLTAELAATQEDNKRLAADNAALVEVERIVREECARVCEAEYVDAEATGTAEDKAYNCAIEHCAAAIREGKT